MDRHDLDYADRMFDAADYLNKRDKENPPSLIPTNCAKAVRGGGTCLLDIGHGGYHSTVCYTCDNCLRKRRGRPHTTRPDGEYEDGFVYCYFCAKDWIS